MKWPLTFYVNNLPEGVAGRANGPVIRIDAKYKDDEGLYQHEFIHVKQWLLTLSLHSLFYRIDWYRLRAEVMAYRKQLKYYDDVYYDGRVKYFARMVATRYDLNVNQETIEKMLREK